MGTKKLQNLMQIISLLIAVSFVTPSCGHSEQNLTLEGYCQLTIGLLENRVGGWQEKIALLEENCGDPRRFLALEATVTAIGLAREDSLYKAYNTNFAECVRFLKIRREQIEGYLMKNPDMNEELENLKAYNDSYIERYEILLARYKIRGEGFTPSEPVPRKDRSFQDDGSRRQ